MGDQLRANNMTYQHKEAAAFSDSFQLNPQEIMPEKSVSGSKVLLFPLTTMSL